MTYKYKISTPQIDIQNLVSVLENESLLKRSKKFLDSLEVFIYINSKDVDTFLSKKDHYLLNNFVYIARIGARFNGYTYAEKVLNSGNYFIGDEELFNNYSIVSHPNFISVTDTEKCLNILYENAFKIEKYKFNTIGVTGTNGKTSVTYITTQLLESLFHEDVLRIGTLGIQLGEQNFPVSHATTPDYPSFLTAVHTAKENGVNKIVMEITSHGLKENRLYNWPINCAIFTNLTQDHLDYHKTMDEYKNTKKKLFLSKLEKRGTSIICTINSEWKEFLEASYGIERTVYGVGYKDQEKDFFKICDNNFKNNYYLSITNLNISLQGISGVFCLKTRDCEIETCNFQSSLIGQFQFDNILCSVAALLYFGFNLSQITEHIKNVKSIPGRLEVVNLPSQFTAQRDLPTVLIDYAHSPDALEKTLFTCRDLIRKENKGKLVCVFGCGGDRDKLKRPIMGKIAEEIADYVIITSDNPRTEEPKEIIKDILAGITNLEKCKEISDREEAIIHAINSAHKHDVVVIAGKGHEDYQIIGDKKYPFSDLQVAKFILSKGNN